MDCGSVDDAKLRWVISMSPRPPDFIRYTPPGARQRADFFEFHSYKVKKTLSDILAPLGLAGLLGR